MTWRAVAVVAAAAVAAPAGWLATDHLERDDDFCNACHLEPGVPLHIEIRREYDARPAVTLAAAHARPEASEPRRATGEPAYQPRSPGSEGFRCIDCHGGVGFVGRARVKMLAAKDAFWYLVGHFEEPTEMRWPLWDRDCLRCHPTFDTRVAAEWETPRFHQLPVHNVDLGVACVSCHPAHGPGGAPEAHFLHVTRVRTECARCHPEFEEGQR
jgi:nitrate/TMAO reductase-like tetraheme cytochrome c subunit